MFGVENRTTKDMDTTITGIDISKDKMVGVLNEILSIDLNDRVKFDIISITDIREEDEYWNYTSWKNRNCFKTWKVK